MLSASSISSASQSNFQQLRLQEVRRSADQAELVAQSLKAQANDAQRVADGAQENANSLTTQSDRAQATADQVRIGLAILVNSQGQVVGKIINTSA